MLMLTAHYFYNVQAYFFFILKELEAGSFNCKLHKTLLQTSLSRNHRALGVIKENATSQEVKCSFITHDKALWKSHRNFA